MTLFIPDISHHQAGISISRLKSEGSAALIARVGQAAGRRRSGQQYGTTRDREWSRHRDAARSVGLPLVAYWYVGNLVSAADNAAIAKSWVGDTSIPWMIDHEDASGDIAFYHAVLQAFANAGLRVVLGYIPKWYYDAVGGGSLWPGPPIVNSRYSIRNGTAQQIYDAAGGDKGNGWIDFGNQKTVLWQFTNKASMAGMNIDMSAYKGTHDELMALISGKETEELDAAERNALFSIYNALFKNNAGELEHPTQGDQSIITRMVELQQGVRALLGRNPEDTDEEALADFIAVRLATPLANELAERGVGGATPDQVKEAVRAAFARAGQEGETQ